MPEMDGYEFSRRIRYGIVPGYKSVPIIMLTGKDSDWNVQRAAFHKINGYVVKPPQAEDLKRRIEIVVGDQEA